MKLPKKKIRVQKKDKIDIKKYLKLPQSNPLYTKPLSNYNTLSLNSPSNTDFSYRTNYAPNQKIAHLIAPNESINLNTEPNDNINFTSNNYFNFSRTINSKKNNYSEKIRLYRENLNDIVKKLNESNNKYKNIINRNNDFKENISLNSYNHDYKEYYTQIPKNLTTYYSQNRLNNLDTFNYFQKNKNKVIKNCGEKTEIRNKNKTLNIDDKYSLTNKRNNQNNYNRFEQNKKNNSTFTNINKLRDEFKQISSNYMEVSQKIDTINKTDRDNNNDISYEEIIKSNSKLNDILSYNYKANNDTENEKVFILMKLRLKNAQIIINKLENEKKKYINNFNKKNNIAKVNNIIENKSKELKIENEQLYMNINLINEELEEYKNKFNNMNMFNKKIQEINKKLTDENNDLKNNNYKKIKIVNENKYKELKENYKKISEDNKNLKNALNELQTKYKILQDIHLELKQNLDKKTNNEIDSLRKKCIEYETQISELKNLEKKYNKLKSTNRNLIQEKNNLDNKCKELLKNKEENNNMEIKKTFSDLYKKYVCDKIKENKLKMIIGIYLQKQDIKNNQKIKEYKDKNKKLAKSIKKLNAQIIEYKLNKLNYTDKTENDKNI